MNRQARRVRTWAHAPGAGITTAPPAFGVAERMEPAHREPARTEPGAAHGDAPGLVLQPQLYIVQGRPAALRASQKPSRWQGADHRGRLGGAVAGRQRQAGAAAPGGQISAEGGSSHPDHGAAPQPRERFRAAQQAVQLGGHQRQQHRAASGQRAALRQQCRLAQEVRGQPAQLRPPLPGPDERHQAADVVQRQRGEVETLARIDALLCQPDAAGPGGGLQMLQGLQAPATAAAAAAAAEHQGVSPGRVSPCRWPRGISQHRRFQQRSFLWQGQPHQGSPAPVILELLPEGLRIVQAEGQLQGHCAASQTVLGSRANSSPCGRQPGARPGAVGVGPRACRPAR